MDLRRIDLTPRSLDRSPRSWISKHPKRTSLSLGLMAPILAIVVLMLPSSSPPHISSIGFERTSFATPMQGPRAANSLVVSLLSAIQSVAHRPLPTPTASSVPVPAPAVISPPVVNPAPAPQPYVDSSSAAAWASSPAVVCIRYHESNDNYSTNTGNGYYGAYQDLLSTWQAAGGTGLPSNAPPAVQDQINYQIWLSGGWGQWSTASECGV